MRSGPNTQIQEAGSKKTRKAMEKDSDGVPDSPVEASNVAGFGILALQDSLAIEKIASLSLAGSQFR